MSGVSVSKQGGNTSYTLEMTNMEEAHNIQIGDIVTHPVLGRLRIASKTVHTPDHVVFDLDLHSQP